MIFLLVSLVLIIIISYILFIWVKQRNLPPGPWSLPILGNLLSINPKAPHETFTEWSKIYGKVYGVHLGNLYTVVLSDAKLIRSVFAKEATTGRAPLYVTHGIMGGYGLICAEGNLWKDQRRFVSNFLKNFGMVKFGSKRRRIEEIIMEEVLNCLDDLVETSPIDPLNILRHGMGSVICEMVFGKKWPKDDQLWKWLQMLQEDGTKLIGVSGPLNFFPFLRFVPKFRNMLKFLLDGKHQTHQVYQNLIEEEEKLLISGISSDNLIRSFLLEREKKKGSPEQVFYSNEQFYHLLADVFGAGLDTTLTTLRWYFLYLAYHNDIQKQIQAELDSVLQGRLPSLDDLDYLPLIEASIAETQRIRSVVPMGIPHGTLSDMEIEGFFIPKNSMIVPLQWAVHMDDQEWVHPQEFNPKRFLNDEGRFKKSSTFIPFQTGKRMCVGDELARMLLFLFAATCLQKLTINLEEPEAVDFSGEPGITLTPKKQVLIFKTRLV